jgi:hypothetical protein
MEALCVEVRVRFAFTAQALPSCGERVVVSLSVYSPVWAFQRRLLAAALMVAALGVQEAIDVVSLRIVARLRPRLIV